jgi:hypothetical protein
VSHPLPFSFLVSHLDEHTKAEKVNNSLFHSQLNVNFDCSDFTYMHPFVLDNIEAQLSTLITSTLSSNNEDSED